MKFVDLFLYFSSMESRNKFTNIIIYSSNSVLYLLCSLYPTQQCHQIKYFVTLYVISFQLHQFRDQLDVGGAVFLQQSNQLAFSVDQYVFTSCHERIKIFLFMALFIATRNLNNQTDYGPLDFTPQLGIFKISYSITKE